MECPFCGVETDVPHESQESCIAALQAEIGRVRGVVDSLRSAVVPGPADDHDGPAVPFRATLRDDEEPQL